MIQQQRSQITEESKSIHTTISKTEAQFVILLILSIHITIFSGIILYESVDAMLYYTLGTSFGLVVIYYLFNNGEEANDAIRSVIIASIFTIFLFVVIFFLIDLQDPFFVIAGFIPTFFLIFLKSAPYSITYLTEQVENGVILTIDSNYILSQSSISRQIPEDTIINLIVYSQTLTTVFGPRNFYHHLTFDHISQQIDLLPIAPQKFRGLPLLSLLVDLFPENFIIRTKHLFRTTGGLLSPLEPDIGEVNLTIPSETKYGEPLTQENLKSYLSNPRFSRIKTVSNWHLWLNIIWGIILVSFTGAIAIFTAILAYFAWTSILLISILFASLALANAYLVLFSYNRFILYSIGHLIGEYHFEEKDCSIYLELRRGIFKSNTYQIPLNLNPRIERNNGKISIICRDDYTEYYHLTLGKIQ